ncbi:DUF3298 domain-containing protein [Marinoscillum sp.]|uniref:DUF3298 and DUF4163 domain-containing protein n=1 Tax=Marinoscillum sp. TaxID=2024838 RepID=UPI003BADBB2B
MNRNQNLLLTTFLACFFYSCSVEQSKQEQPVDESTQTVVTSEKGILAVEQVSVSKKANCTSEPCTSVSITYPRYEGYPRFNQIIVEQITSTLSEDYIMEADGSESLDQLVDMFLQSYQEFIENFPESSTAWNLDIEAEQTYATLEVVSLAIKTSGYTGGAHSNSFVEYLTLSESSKKPLELKDIVKNEKKLKQIAEQAFRSHYDIAEEQSFSDFGFTFQNNEFALPETIGLTQQGLVLYYNSYEIAAYAKGPTELVIPFDQIADILKI